MWRRKVHKSSLLAILAIAAATTLARAQTAGNARTSAAAKTSLSPIIANVTPAALRRTSGDTIQPGKYSIGILAHFKGPGEVDAALEATRAGLGRSQVMLRPWESSKSLQVDPANYNLAGCCMDDWKYIDFLVRDINPNPAAKLGILLSYHKFLDSREGGVIKGREKYASGGRLNIKFNEKILLDLSNVRWRPRPLSYPVKRMLNLPPTSAVNVKQVAPDQTFVQFRTDLDLRGQKSLALDLAQCGEVGEINLRFWANHGVHLLTQLDKSAVLTDSGRYKQAIIDLGSVRNSLGLDSSGSDLRLREINLSFPMNQRQTLSCKPLLAIAGVSKVGNLSWSGVSLRTRIRRIGNDYRLLRVRVPTAGNPWDRGHVIDKMVLRVSRVAGSSQPVGVEIVGVWGDTGAKGEPPGNGSQLCLVASKTFVPASFRSSAERCLRPRYHLSLRALVNVYQHRPVSIAGVELVPIGHASFRLVSSANGLKFLARFRRDSDRIRVRLSGLGVMDVPRLIQVTFAGARNLELRPVNGQAEPHKPGMLLVPAGQQPAFDLMRRPVGGPVTTLHQFRLETVSTKLDRAGSGYAVLRWPSQAFQLTVFNGDHLSKRITNLGSVRPETMVPYCGQSPGVKVCSPSELTVNAKGMHLLTKADTNLSFAFAQPVVAPIGSLLLIRSAQPAKNHQRVQFSVRIQTASGRSVLRYGILNHPMPLFEHDEQINSLSFTFSKSGPRRTADIALSDLLILTSARSSDRGGADRNAPQRDAATISVLHHATKSLDPSEILSEGDGIKVTMDGGFVRVKQARISRPSGSDIASWVYSMDLRMRDLVGMDLIKSMTPAVCANLSATIEIQWSNKDGHGANKFLSRCPVDKSVWRIPRDGLVPNGLAPDTTLTRLVVKLTDAVRSEPISAIFSLNVSVDRLYLADQLISGPQLLRVSDVCVRWKRPQAAQGFWRQGGWVSVGDVKIAKALPKSMLHSVFSAVDNPLFSIEAVRLIPLDAPDQKSTRARPYNDHIGSSGAEVDRERSAAVNRRADRDTAARRVPIRKGYFKGHAGAC